MRKVIIFTQFSSMADILERELSDQKPLKITGEVGDVERKNIVNLFNTDDSHYILIMTEAGAYGLNLQAASVIINYDLPWSIAKYEQRIARAHRIGQKDSVLVYNLLAKGTVDYYIKKVLHDKGQVSDKILGDTPITMEMVQEMLHYE